ncbi:MAG: hypothetical protein JWR22_1941 [Herminiimonas sp.]|nr:hypothetical protein [Herminiimonas sp.]
MKADGENRLLKWILLFISYAARFRRLDEQCIAENGVPVEAVFAAPVFQKHRLPRPFCKLMSSGQ